MARRLSLNTQILIGCLAGIAGGLWLAAAGSGEMASNTLYGAKLAGNLFLDLLRMVLVPLIFSSIVTGVANLRAHDQMHRVWTTTLAFFFVTMGIAIVIGFGAAHLFQPGAGLSARSAVTAAAERQLAMRDQQEAARRKLLRQLEADWSDLTALESLLQPSRQLVDNTRSVVESYARQYTAGRKSWLDVLNAQREAAQALYGLADVEANRLRAQLRLEINTGRLSARSLSEP